MTIRPIGKIIGGQDGAIWGKYLFRFDTRGNGSVTDLSFVTPDGNSQLAPFACFTLDKADRIVPHSNAVMFGYAYFAEGDPLPLLYSNVYNNYAKAEDPLKGVCCVYRLLPYSDSFSTELVQLISIGFTENTELWKSDSETADVRPYGNFTVDRENNRLYAFVMRDARQTTRYFSFAMPKVHDGEWDPVLGVRKVVLGADDILDAFDCPYHRYMQGACTHGGKIYSCEGFSNNQTNRPAIRVISLKDRRQELYIDLLDLGYTAEPEMIDFYGETCYYSDCHGNLYTLEL